MNSKNYIIGLSLMLLLLNVSTASAFYKLDSSGSSRVNSEGFNVPFPHALQMIHPEGWDVVIQGDMGISAVDVSWGNEATWEEAVLATAKAANSSVKIDYTDKKIFVSKNPPGHYVLRSTNSGYAKQPTMQEVAGEYVFEETMPVRAVQTQRPAVRTEIQPPASAQPVSMADGAAAKIEAANKATAAAEARAAAAEEKASKAMKAAEEAQAISKAMLNTAETNVGAKALAETKARDAAKVAEHARLEAQEVREETNSLIAAAQEQVQMHAKETVQAREAARVAEEARLAAEKKAADALEAVRVANEKLAKMEEAQRLAEARIQEVEQSKAVAMQEAAKEAVQEVTTVKIEGQTVALPIWNLTKGSLKSQLAEWAQSEGYQFVWRPAFDVTLGANVEVHGTLHDAFAKVLDGLKSEGTRLSADIYESNKLIIVTGE